MDNKEPIARPRGRPANTRTPIGRRNILTVSGKEPGFVYRIVNNSGDRVQMFEEAGYVIEQADKIVVGDKRVNRASATGSAAEVSVGNGEKALVMKIREDWYKDDQEAKQKQVDLTEAGMLKSARNGNDYGKIENSRG